MVTVTKNTPSVSVIISSYNGKHLLKDCLSSLYELRYPSKSLDIKVIDNLSTDGTAQYVHRNFRKVQVLRNDENNFCRANNLGIKNSRSEMVAFLNNDTKVEKEWLKALVDSIGAEDRIGCAGSKVLFPDGKIQSTGHYEFPNFRWGDRGLREPDIGQYESTEEVNSLSGSSVLFRRSCLDDVGYFDEDFVMYLEDVDIFLRCRKKNWKLLYVPTSIVYHKFHGTVDEKSVRFYIERNRLLLIAKHFPHELSRALESKEYSLRHEELYSILPDLFFKLLKHHNRDSLQTTLKDFFASLQKVYNLSKDQAVQELNNSLADTRKQMDADMQNEKARLEAEILKSKESVDTNYAQLEELKKTLLEKDALLQEVSQARLSMETKVSQLAEVQDKLAQLQQERENLSKELILRGEEMVKERENLSKELILRGEEMVKERENLSRELSLRGEELAKDQEFTNTLKEEVNALEHKIELMHLESTHREDKLAQLQQERENLSKELILRGEEMVKERENLSRELSLRGEELIKGQEFTNTLKEEVNALEHKIELMHLESTHREDKFAELEKERQALAQELSLRGEELVKEREYLNAIKAEVMEMVKERENLSRELSLRGEELIKGQEFTNTLKEEVNALEHKIELMHLESTHREDKLAQLQQERENLSKELILRGEEMVKERENLSRELSLRGEELAKDQEFTNTLKEEVNALEHKISLHKEELSQSRKQAQQLSTLVNQQQDKISALITEFETTKAQMEAEKIKLSQAEGLNASNKSKIEALMVQIQHQQKIIFEKESYIRDLFDSRTFRRLVIPLWHFSDFVKVHLLGRRKEKQILVIKPYYVSAEETGRALQDLRTLFPTAKITLFANLLEDDYDRLKAETNASELMLYSPGHIKLTKARLFLAWLKFNIRYFDDAIVLVGAPVYHGYRKAKVMAWLASAKSAKVYFVTSKAFAPLYTTGILSRARILFESAFQSMAFMGVIIFFIIFVVLPLKLRKIFER